METELNTDLPPLQLENILEAPTPSPALRMQALCAEIYYHHQKGCYYRKDHKGKWIKVNQEGVERGLRRKKFVKDTEECIEWIQDNNSVGLVAPLSGYKQGSVVELGDERALITGGPQIAAPVKGDWPFIHQIIDGLLGGHSEQVDYFLGWLSVAARAQQAGATMPGQIAIFIGAADAGKSLCQLLIDEVLGGRSTDPYVFMTKSSFNRDLFCSEHLKMEDKAPKIDEASRANFGAMLKQLAVNQTHRFEGKGQDAIGGLKPFWRVSISLNDEPKTLLMLPSLDASMLDKIFLFKARKATIPFADGTLEGRAKVDAIVKGEMPAFMHFLLHEYEIQEKKRSRRFGITHFHHPDLVAKLQCLDPEMRLLQLVEEFIIRSCEKKEWIGRASELERYLLGIPAIRNEVGIRILNYNGAAGMLLAKLELRFPERVKKLPGRVDGKRVWRITLSDAQDDYDTFDNEPPTVPTLAEVIPDNPVPPNKDQTTQVIPQPVYTAKDLMKLEYNDAFIERRYTDPFVAMSQLYSEFSMDELYTAVEELEAEGEYVALTNGRLVPKEFLHCKCALDAIKKAVYLAGTCISEEECLELAGEFWEGDVDLINAFEDWKNGDFEMFLYV